MFSGSSFYSIKKFDYPFPLEESDYSEMFYQCTELVYANLKNLTFENTIDVSSMLSYCKKLETIIFPQNSKSSNVESFREMFSHAESLTYIDLSGINFLNAKDLSYMFYGCSNLKTLILPSNEKASNVVDFSYMFYDCRKLTSIDLSNFSFVKTKNLSNMFFFCSNLENLILPKNEIATYVENISFMFSDCYKLEIIDLSGISLTNIKDISYLFSNCTNLESIIFANDEPINKIEKMSYAFYNCYKLKSIDLSKFNINLVTNLEYMFDSCSSLETIKLPEQKINNVENFFHIFNN